MNKLITVSNRLQSSDKKSAIIEAELYDRQV